MKKPPIDYSAHKNLQELVEKWREIVGVDRIYDIQIIESPEDTGHPAWIDGLSIDNPHPVVNIFVSSNWINTNRHNEKAVVEIIIHELIHIIVFQAFVMIDPNYKYDGVKALSNEILTMKITSGFMKILDAKK